MTEKEKNGAFTPRKCETQIEFEEVMMQINDAQQEENTPYKEQIARFDAQRLSLESEILKIKIQLIELKQARLHVEKDLKKLNKKYHDLKHSWIVLNPREDFVKPEETSEG